MRTRRFASGGVLALALLRCAPPSGALSDPRPRGRTHDGDPPVEEATPGGASFVLHDRPFCFLGTNNYYVTYKPRAMTDEVLESAHRMGVRVLRVWANIDRGSLDETVESVDPPGHKDGVYFQYWDPVEKRARFNDGEDGLMRLDYVLHKSRALDLKLILVLTNNWREFGGMEQYLRWYGLFDHHAFYDDSRIQSDYKHWAEHLVNRRNQLDGVLYRDDPTIFAWELANEPRCKLVAFTGKTGCAPDTVARWAAEMSTFLHAIDPHHLVSVGDEGFLTGGEGFGRDGREGVDHAVLSALPQIDFATYHLYPDTWGTDARWSRLWIEEHIALARALHKPTLLEEYGVTAVAGEPGDQERRAQAYARWHELVVKRGGSGALFWMLAAHDERGARYPDYDHFAIYPDERVANLLAHWAPRFAEQSVACREPPPGDLGARGSPFVMVTH